MPRTGKSPANSSKMYTTKSSTYFSRQAGPKVVDDDDDEDQ